MQQGMITFTTMMTSPAARAGGGGNLNTTRRQLKHCLFLCNKHLFLSRVQPLKDWYWYIKCFWSQVGHFRSEGVTDSTGVLNG